MLRASFAHTLTLTPPPRIIILGAYLDIDEYLRVAKESSTCALCVVATGNFPIPLTSARLALASSRS